MASIVFALAVAAGAVLCRAIARPDCTCPGPCHRCPPLRDDHQADAEYRASRHMFHNSTAPGSDPGAA